MRPATSVVSLRHLALALTTLVAAACASDPAGTRDLTTDDATGVVNTFARLADSVSNSGGDTELGTVYASLAEAVRLGGRVSPVTIVVDGVATPFLATAQQTEIANSPCGAMAGCLALGVVSIQRSLIAWQQDNPKRIVQLSSASDKDSVYTQIFPSFAAPMFPTASFVFIDGNGGIYFGTSGTQSASMVAEASPCNSIASDRPTIAIYPAPAICSNADFTMAFAARAEPSSFLGGKTNSTGSHTLSMTAQSVAGARFQFSPGLPPQPPIPLAPTVYLPAELTAQAPFDGDVTLTFTITNNTGIAATLQFSSGQRYDFSVIDASTGATVWTWSADKSFIAALGTESLAANGALTYTATWTPPRKGNFIAVGTLTSLSHSAAAKTMVVTK